MKRILALSGITMFFAMSFIHAEEAILIDFSNLATGDDGEHTETSFDYSPWAGDGYTDEEKAMMKTSYAIKNWVVALNSSARSSVADRLTTVRSVDSAFRGTTVAGVRVHFPSSGSSNANATMRPPYPVPAMAPNLLLNNEADLEAEPRNYFDDNPYVNRGLLNNVGVIKMVEMNVRGLNFPHSVSVLLERIGGRVEEIPMGSLDFDGWKTLTWTNPSYAFEVRQRDLRRMPLYPYTVPYVKLNGIRFHRSGQHDGGDFIAYVQNVTLVYDKAVRDDVPVDIDDEAIWHILRSRELARMRLELRTLGERLVYEFTQAQLMDNSRSRSYPAYGPIPVNDRRPVSVNEG